MISFKIEYQYKNARTGVLNTAHGDIYTPVFMPVGTRATVKAVSGIDLINVGSQIILGNTYHLMLQPGAEKIAKAGGLHKFMNWGLPILTDSGGFQVMSLSKLTKVNENGVSFRSHIDGSSHVLTPEISTEIQYLLGSDITMVLDECISFPAVHKEAERAMELSMRWAERSKTAFKRRPGYGQFGIVQGSIFEDLRVKSVHKLIDIGFDGYAIGGLAVGEGHESMVQVLDYTTPHLPYDKARYLMGVGKPKDLIAAVARGIDMFDCVIPTRSGRNGQAWTKMGAMNIRNAKYTEDYTPIEQDCRCYACQNHTKAYISHLSRCSEILGATLLTIHNLYYFHDLMRRIRSYIQAGRDFDFEF